MARKRFTAPVAALALACCAVAAALGPCPFVVRGLGTNTDLLASDGGAPLVSVAGMSNPTSGRLLMSTSSVSAPDHSETLISAIRAYLAADSDVVPRASVYAADATVASVHRDNVAAEDSAKMDATAAALQLAHMPITSVPVVTTVSEAGPASGRLQANDIILTVDGSPVAGADDVTGAISVHKVGESVTFEILRGAVKQTVVVSTISHQTDPNIPVVGAAFGPGYRYDTNVHIAVDAESAGASAGLMMALAVYDKVTPTPLLRDLTVAGTGAIDGSGGVSSVDGVREKLGTAQAAGATVFLMPRTNCSDLAGASAEGVRVVPVSTLSEAVDDLTALQDPAKSASVKGCS